jgi:hypothetical protein
VDIITTTDLASYLREPNPDEAVLGLLVELANGIVTDAVGTDLTAPYPAGVRAVTLEVAARAYRNPEGASSETIDDYTFRRDGATASGGVYLTDTERTDLARLVGGRARVRSVRLVTGYESA